MSEQWRLAPLGPSVRHLRVRFVASIPNVPWSEELCKEIRPVVLFEPGKFSPLRERCWFAADGDHLAHRPQPFVWIGANRPLPFFEGEGGVPMAMVLWCRDLVWEVLVASETKAWIELEGYMGRGCSAEEIWRAPSFQERARREVEEHEREQWCLAPPPSWRELYDAHVRGRLAQGHGLAEAHWRTAHAMGETWVRREGDPNYYGTIGCTECMADEWCGLCDYANRRGTLWTEC